LNQERTQPSALAWLALAGTLTLLGGCQHPAPTAPPAPPQQVETGSRFHLRTPLTFPAGNPELLFQNLQVVNAARLSKGMPFCSLKPAKGAGPVIQPGRYTVGAVSYDEKEIGTTSAMLSATRIALGAEAGQSTYALSCGWPEGAPSRGFLTTQQIYNAIGGQFSMDLLR
jgi:hypothetical protein